MPQAYYNQNYEDNRIVMGSLVGAAVDPTIATHSGLPVHRLPLSALGMLSTGALQDMIKGLAKGAAPASAKGVHRNEWGYLPGNRYAEAANGELTTQLFGEDIPVLKSRCQFQEYYFDNGDDLKAGRNADRRVVHDQDKKLVYLTMVHYDRWVKGPRNADGSPKGGGVLYNPFLLLVDVA